jgi:hypothetical protein
MTIARFINKDNVRLGSQPIQERPQRFSQVTKAAFNATVNNYNSNSASNLFDNQLEKRSRAYRDATGKELKPEDYSGYQQMRQKLELDGVDISTINEGAMELLVGEVKVQDPTRFKEVLTIPELSEAARSEAKLSSEEFAVAQTYSSSFDSTAASLLGGLGGTAVDPINIATLPFGFGASKTFLSFVAKEAAFNAGIEALTQPFVAQWQRELGNEYGFAEAAENVGLAAMFGGVFAGVTRGLKPTAQWIFAKASANKLMSSTARRSAGYISRYAHVREANPVMVNPTTLARKDHMGSVDATQRALKEERNVDAIDLPTSNYEFNTVNSKISASDTAIQRTRKEFLQQYQEDVTSIRNPEYDIPTMPEQLLRKANEAEGDFILNRDIHPIETEMLKSAGIKKTPLGWDVKGLRKEFAKREEDGLLNAVNSNDTAHIQEWRNNVTEQDLRNRKADTSAEDITQDKVDTGLYRQDTASPEVRKQTLDSQASKETFEAETAAFNDFVEENANVKLTQEDGSVITVRQLAKELDDDTEFVKEMTACSRGE